MRSWFHARGYPKHLVQKEMKKFKFTNINRDKRIKKNQRSYVCGYIPPLTEIFAELNNKHLGILYIDEETKKVFTLRPMITIRSARKLSSYLE